VANPESRAVLMLSCVSWRTPNDGRGAVVQGHLTAPGRHPMRRFSIDFRHVLGATRDASSWTDFRMPRATKSTRISSRGHLRTFADWPLKFFTYSRQSAHKAVISSGAADEPLRAHLETARLRAWRVTRVTGCGTNRAGPQGGSGRPSGRQAGSLTRSGRDDKPAIPGHGEARDLRPGSIRSVLSRNPDD